MDDDYKFITLPIREKETPNFEYIYEVGRLLNIAFKKSPQSSRVRGKYIYENGRYQNNDIREEKIEALRKTMHTIIKVAETMIDTFLVELSIFDPKDPTCESFYTVLFGQWEVVERYVEEMEKNLKAEEQKDQQSRGALFPNPALYESALYAKRFSEETAIKCKRLDLSNFSIWFGAYRASEDAMGNTANDTLESVSTYVESFFDRIMNKALGDADGKIEADFALLVPMARPIGTIKGGNVAMKLRGGGLFLFGKWKEKLYQPGRFALGISNVLNRAIMAISYSSLEHVGALEKQSLQSYTAQGHEIRKIIPWVKGGTPETILTQFRTYITTLFAVGDKEIREHELNRAKGMYPPEFARGKTLYEFIENAWRVALRVETMIEWCDKNDSTKRVSFDEEAVNRWLKQQMAQHLGQLNAAQSHILDEEITETPEDRWYFFCALVCAFRNVKQHKDPKTAILVTIESEGKVLVIRNQADADENAVTGRKVRQKKSKSWRGSTEEAIKFYVCKFGGDEQLTVSRWEDEEDEENLTRETMIPLPNHFIYGEDLS